MKTAAMNADSEGGRRALRLAQLARLGRTAFAASMILLAAGCATRPSVHGTTFVVVRHAEKATDDPRDPTLSKAGQQRADALAERLREADIAAIYATQYRRTQQTAEPVARSHGVEVTRYEAGEPVEALARRLRDTHAAGTVLVVGHSNTAPQIAAALCACPVAPLSEADYGDLYRISTGRSGRPALAHERY
jgi:broad specificity phosphatase PhoE